MTLSFETAVAGLQDHYSAQPSRLLEFTASESLTRVGTRQHLYENSHSVFWCPPVFPGHSNATQAIQGLLKAREKMGRPVNVAVDFLPGRPKTEWRKRFHARLQKEVGVTLVCSPYSRKEWDAEAWLASMRPRLRRRIFAVLCDGLAHPMVNMKAAAKMARSTVQVLHQDLPILQEAELVTSESGKGTWLINPDFVKASILRMTDKEIERVVELPPSPEQLYVPPKSKPKKSAKKSADKKIAGRRRAVLDVCKSHNISLLATEEILEAAGLPPL